MNGPFLELNFYQDENEQDFLVALIDCLIENGAKLSGKALIHRGPNINQQPFGFSSDEYKEEIEIASVDDLRAIKAVADSRLVQVPITNASGLTRGAPELVTVTGISEWAASRGDNHPVAIWASGDKLDFETLQSHALATKAYRRFITIVEQLAPAYAAITMECSLECPMDLRRDPKSYAFHDFYLSNQFFDDALISSVVDLCSDRFIKPLSNGVYISTSGLFMPKPPKRSSQKPDLSTQIGQLIASSERFRTYR
ncbi:hypothetical protein CCAX7_002350 [Capsulimonas corticalis]|uniref:Uncharacterized protein n=1 Tax=Capsulimonas corticalis TaxID=2219043 RepID=A0A402CRZ1_9BACT|nr:hypothetical protein [Capsulimonas corticalis]BDI28184.1 hypothetical protein CCAX7_002350 [Capsulimonas corticalis]